MLGILQELISPNFVSDLSISVSRQRTVITQFRIQFKNSNLHFDAKFSAGSGNSELNDAYISMCASKTVKKYEHHRCIKSVNRYDMTDQTIVSDFDAVYTVHHIAMCI